MGAKLQKIAQINEVYLQRKLKNKAAILKNCGFYCFLTINLLKFVDVLCQT